VYEGNRQTPALVFQTPQQAEPLPLQHLLPEQWLYG